MRCRELVELVTDYLDGSIDDETARALSVHTEGCRDCTAYVEQMRLTIRLIAAVPGPEMASERRDELLRTFCHRQSG